MSTSLLTSLIYPKKVIPKTAVLYRSVHFTLISPDLRPRASVFSDEQLSCDWDRYSTPTSCRDLIGKQFKHNTFEYKNKNQFFICSIKVGENLKLDPSQEFLHDPIFHFPSKKGSPNNRAHSLIKGDKSEKAEVKARKQLAKNSKWVLFDENEYNILKSKI